MEMAVMQVGLLLKVCALICSWMILGSAVSPVGDGALRHLSGVNAFTSIAPVPEPNGPGLLPPLIMPPQLSSPAPQTAESISPSAWPSPSASPPNVFAPPPAKANVPSMAPIRSLEKPQPPEPPYPVQAPAPQTVKSPPPTAWPSPSTSPTNLSVSPPAPVVAYVPPMAPIPPPEKLQPPEPQLPTQAPAPDTSPRSSPPYMQTYPPVPETEPGDPHHSKAPINGAPRTVVSPVSDVPAPIGMLHSPPHHEAVINAPPSRGMPDAPPPSQSVPNAPSPRGTPVAPPPSQLVANSPSHKETPYAPPPSQSVTNTSSPRGTPNTALPSQSVSNASSPKGMQDTQPPSQSVSHVPAPRGMLDSPSPPDSAVPVEPPSPPPPDVPKHPPSRGISSPTKPSIHRSSSSPPEQNDSPVASPPSISKRTAARPVAAPRNITVRHSVPGRHSPSEAPKASNRMGQPSSSRPHHFSKTAPVHSPLRSYHPMVHKITPAPQMQVIPPTSDFSQWTIVYILSKNISVNRIGSSPSSPPIPPTKDPPTKAPSLAPPFRETKVPAVSPIVSPSVPSTRRPKRPLSPPLQILPPPPPQKDCAPLTCIEPLTYGPPESPCICVLPMQVGLRLSIAPYTFFPLVSELAAEIAVGAFMRQSQVRIMGATPAGYDPDKTVVIIYLLPVGEKIDDTTAYLIFQRFWRKQVAIKASFFGDYDVLYVRYPGLPPSPPLPPSAIGIIASKPYPGHDNNARTMQPFGVDVSGKQHKHGIRGSILATIIMSCFVAVILICAVGWILIFRYRYQIFQPDPTPPAAVRSMAKSSGIAASMRSGPSSPSFSLGSSIAAYTGSVRTFSASEIKRATDFFDKTRILGEGGFGRVYSAALDDGTKVAIKVLKRLDQQSGREFLAEVEMLSRLHHRNLVKLIGLCAEDRIHCLMYELIPNGSVESHLHGIDKERSPLDWSARLKIALGAARALAYLHEDSSPRVIHRDFKASNILLEDDFTPKVSDFGLARTALDEENRHISTRVMGTFGYVAPEYAMTGHLLVKSDVYSYGVVLLELLSGRKPVDMYRPPGEENLVSWARSLLTSQEGLEAIMDQSLGPDFPLDSIAKIAAITSMCVQPEVSHRPFMGEVVQALKLVVRNECDRMKESPSRSSSHDVRPTAVEQMPTSLLSPSTIYEYDYRLDLERDLIMSDLLGSSTKSGNQDIHQSCRRYSSSGPLRTGKEKTLWKTMRQFKRNMSQHGVPFKPRGNSY